MNHFFPYYELNSKVGDRSRGRPEVSLFNSEYTEVSGRALLLSLDFSSLPLIHTLYCWVLSKEVSSTIFKVFGMTRPGIEPRSTGPLANTLPTNPMSRFRVGDHSRGWPEGSLFDSLLHQGVGEGATPFPGLLHFTLDPYLIMLSVKQGGIKYHFLSLWYDSTWYWTQVSRAIGEHSNRFSKRWIWH